MFTVQKHNVIFFILMIAAMAIHVGCGSASSNDRDAADQFNGPETRELPAPKGLFNYEVVRSPRYRNSGTGDEITLTWAARLDGDYNNDGGVNGLDLFPLSANFNEDVHEDPDHMLIDGNNDGVLDGEDLYLITANYLSSLQGFHVDITWADGQARLTNPPITYEGRTKTYTFTFTPDAQQMAGLSIRVLAYADFEDIPLDVSDPLMPFGPEIDGFDVALPNLNTNLWDSAAGFDENEIRIAWVDLDGQLHFTRGDTENGFETHDLDGGAEMPVYWPSLAETQRWNDWQIAYVTPNGAKFDAKFQQYIGNQWFQVDVVDNVTTAPSFDTTRFGEIQMLSFVSDNDGDRFVFSNGVCWSFVNTDIVAEEVGQVSDIELVSSDNQVSAIFTANWAGKLGFITRTGFGPFTVETIENTSIAKSHLVVMDGVPHVFYSVWNGGLQELRHAVRLGEDNWQIETIDDDLGMVSEKFDTAVVDGTLCIAGTGHHTGDDPDMLSFTENPFEMMSAWNQWTFSPERTGTAGWDLHEGLFNGTSMPVVAFSIGHHEDSADNRVRFVFPEF